MIDDYRKIEKLRKLVRQSNMLDTNKKDMLDFLNFISTMIGASK